MNNQLFRCILKHASRQKTKNLIKTQYLENRQAGGCQPGHELMCRDLIPLQPGQARASVRHCDSPRLLAGFICSLREPWAQQLCLPLLGTMWRAGEQQRAGKKLELNPRRRLESHESYGQAPRTPSEAWFCLSCSCCEPGGICLCMLAAYSLPAIKSNKSSNQERGRRVHTAGPAKKGTGSRSSHSSSDN